jgi:molybdate transport system substrate-binding protein
MLRRVSGVLVVALLLAGCAGGHTARDTARDTMTVFAATSLTGAFTEIGQAFEHANAGSHVRFNFAASSALAQQIADGATPDVFASADRRASSVFARNRLVIATKPNNPQHIKHVADLVRAGVVSLCADEVPCGEYARQALAKAHVALEEAHVTRAPNVAAALSAVSDGDAVAAIVYATDARAARSRVDVVAIPDADNVFADYTITEVHKSADGRAFIAFVRGEQGRKILRHYGFLEA